MANDDKKAGLIIPLLILICFVIVLLSINMIINIALTQPSITAQKQESKPFSKEINTLIKTSKEINYQMLKSNYSASFLNETGIQHTFDIKPQLNQLSIEEQDKVIRLKLLEWQIKQIQNQLSLTNPQNQSLVFKLGFWVGSLLIWIFSIIGGKMLVFYTDEYIIPKFKK